MALLSCVTLSGMERIVESRKTLQKDYDYPLFGPHVKDKQSLNMMLDLCVKHDVPFMFDVISSGGMTLASTPQSASADPSHGCEISLEDLDEYKKRYGTYLAGLRFMEVFGQDYTVREINTRYPEWVHEGYREKPDADVPFFDPAILRGYLEFAQNNAMFVQWSEWHWFHDNDWDSHQKERSAIESQA